MRWLMVIAVLGGGCADDVPCYTRISHMYEDVNASSAPCRGWDRRFTRCTPECQTFVPDQLECSVVIDDVPGTCHDLPGEINDIVWKPCGALVCTE